MFGTIYKRLSLNRRLSTVALILNIDGKRDFMGIPSSIPFNPCLESSLLKNDQDVDFFENQSLDGATTQPQTKEEEKKSLLFLNEDTLLEIFSYLSPHDLQRMGLTNKEFHGMCQTNWLWKKHVLKTFSECIPLIPAQEQLTINWCSLYKTEQIWKDNSIQFIRKYACAAFPRTHRTTLTSHPYFLSLDEDGRLKALAYFKKPITLKNEMGTSQLIPEEDWKIKLLVHSQFVQLATLDGFYPIDTTVKLEMLEPLSPLQTRRIDQLNKQIQSWLETTAKIEDLDDKVTKALASHFTPMTAIQGVRGGESLITAEVKAYFVFFRDLSERFKFLKDQGILFKPTAASSFPTSQTPANSNQKG